MTLRLILEPPSSLHCNLEPPNYESHKLQGADDKLGQTPNYYKKRHSSNEYRGIDLKICTCVPWYVLN